MILKLAAQKLSELFPPIAPVKAIILLIALLILFPWASADIPVPGMSEYSPDYVISNIGDYPDYIFLTSSMIWGWDYTAIVNESTGTFGGGYKLDSYILHAVKASDFDMNKFHNSETGYSRDTSLSQAYLENNTKIVSSDIDLPKATLINDSIPLNEITVYLKVNSITDKALNVSKTKVAYLYDNGHTEIKPIVDNGDVPAPA